MDVQVSMPPPPPPPPLPPPAFFAETTTSQLTAPPPPTQSATTTTTATVSVTSAPTQDRIWLHPWTVNEMREHASQWSLAGDAGVLLYLEQFSDKLTQRADAIHQHLNQTVNAVKSTHTRVLNCLNEFTSLANTQFIENRVYDEDETASNTTTGSKKDDQSTDKTNVNNNEAQEKVLQRYVEAIQYGLAILDTHFEHVEAKLDPNQNGGSSFVEDDEDGGVPLEPILEPKDPYIFRPLPHLIGTTEFMQDDYVGLGDLLKLHDEEGYGIEQIEKVESDSALSSSDDDDDEEEEEEKDSQVQMSAAPIVPAGASRPDLTNRPPPTTSVFNDSEDDDDDPFGVNKTLPKFDNISSKQTTEDDNLFDDEPKPRVLPLPKKDKFTLESDNEDEEKFSIPSQKAPQPVIENNDGHSDDEDSSASSKEWDEPEQPKPKVMTELEKAVLRRRKAMGDPDLPPDGDDEDADPVQKPSKKSKETTSLSTNKTKSEPSPSTIANLTSQPLTTPSKISEKSIFGEQDDDDNDIFKIESKLPPTTTIDTKPSLKLPQKKEKEMFDDSDEGEDLFSPKPKKPVLPSIPPTKIESLSTPSLTQINKLKANLLADDSDDEDFFEKKATPTKPAHIPGKKETASSSDEELLPTESQPPPTKKVSDDEDPLSAGQSLVPRVAPTSVVVPPIKNSALSTDEDSDDQMFGVSKKSSTTGTPKVSPSTKLDDDEEEEMFGKPAPKPSVLSTVTPKVNPVVLSDDEENLFSPKPSQVKLPPPVHLPRLPTAPSITTNVYDDPLGIIKPAQIIPQPSKKTFSDDDNDDEENAPSKPEINKTALKEGEKRSVKDLAGVLKLGSSAFKPGAFKPGARPKASSITEESPKPSVVDDDQPVQNLEPPPSARKALPKSDSDSDDDPLFNPKKKETPKTPIVEPKANTNTEKEPEKTSIKDRASLIKIPPMPHTLSAPPKRTTKEENESNDPIPTTSKEESTVDKTMINILKDRITVGPKKTPRSKPSHSTRAAASTNETDDFFASSNSTNITTSSPPSIVAPIIPPTAPAVLPEIPPPSVAVPVTGLPDKAVAIAAKQTNSKEKKKFSLFDSDDSDIDELLFGSSNKKNKSPAVSKPTTTPSATTKATTKSSVLPLDDDDDFLSKRPPKKNVKFVDNDDIFADVKSKTPQGNKAKKDWSIMNKSATDETDDIFNNTSTKSTTTAKSKPTNVKDKKTENIDDIFGDPLNILSKR